MSDYFIFQTIIQVDSDYYKLQIVSILATLSQLFG